MGSSQLALVNGCSNLSVPPGSDRNKSAVPCSRFSRSAQPSRNDLSARQASPGCSSAIPELGNSVLLGTVITAKESPVLLKAVANYPHTTRRTGRGKRMNCALETIIGVDLPVLGDLERLVVIIAAGFTFRHSTTCKKDFA